MGRKGNCGRKAAEWINGVKVPESVKAVLAIISEVYFFKGCKDSLEVFIRGGKKRFLCITMKDMLKLLDRNVFVRTQKCFIVNMKLVKKINERGDGYEFEFKGTLETALLSPTYLKEFYPVLVLYPEIEHPEMGN